MLGVGLAGDHLLGKSVAGGVCDGVFLCCPLSSGMSWMGSLT